MEDVYKRQDVQHRADDQRGNDANRQVALRVLRFLGHGGDGVEADVGEEDGLSLIHI